MDQGNSNLNLGSRKAAFVRNSKASSTVTICRSEHIVFFKADSILLSVDLAIKCVTLPGTLAIANLILP